MAISALKASQLATLLAGHAKMFTANNPGQNEFADYLLRSGQSATMGLLAEEEEKKRKKEGKAKMFGKLGNLFGGSVGGTLAYKASGGSDSFGTALASNTLDNAERAIGMMGGGGQGGLAGQYMSGKSGDLASNVQTSGVQPDIPASPDIAAKMGTAQANALPSIMTTSPGATANVPAAASALTPRPSTGRYAVDPTAKNIAMMKTPGQLGVPSAAQRTRPTFGSRLFGALNHTMNPQQAQRPTGKLIRVLPDGTEIYE